LQCTTSQQETGQRIYKIKEDCEAWRQRLPYCWIIQTETISKYTYGLPETNKYFHRHPARFKAAQVCGGIHAEEVARGQLPEKAAFA
jgi:hypothetical protein